MHKLTQVSGIILLAALVSFGATRLFPASGATVVKAKESGFERVMRTGILRCAYLIYPPETIKDPNTGKLSGTTVETTEEVARQLGLKVEWTAEVGFQDMFEGFKTGRYDAFCSGVWEMPGRTREALFTIPWNYGASYTFVRADDTRFDDSLDAINDPNVKIAQLDGEAGQIIADENYPKAGRYLLPPLNDISHVLEAVATRKADVAFLQIGSGRGYLKSNPGKLKIIRKAAARAFPAPLIALRHGDYDLKYILDAAMRTLQENGFVERVLRKYDPDLDSYLLVAKPYQAR